jgi:hypothetical protein
MSNSQKVVSIDFRAQRPTVSPSIPPSETLAEAKERIAHLDTSFAPLATERQAWIDAFRERIAHLDTSFAPERQASWANLLLATRNAALASSKPAEHSASADHASKPGGKIMADNPTREEMKAQIDASKASMETLVTRLEGKIETLVATIGGRMDVLASKIDALGDKVSAADAYNRGTRAWVIGTVITVGLALGGVIAAMLSYGDSMFGHGLEVRQLVQTMIKEQQSQAPPERK